MVGNLWDLAHSRVVLFKGSAWLILLLYQPQGGMELGYFIHIAAALAVCLSMSPAVAQDKVVVVPLGTKAKVTDKLWGQGRPGVSLLTHATPSGYCSANGINFALSFNISTWNSAASVCPSGTWVCLQDEIGSACPLPEGSYPTFLCDGSVFDSPIVLGWNAEADPVDQTHGITTYHLNTPHTANVCNNLHVWCCWK